MCRYNPFMETLILRMYSRIRRIYNLLQDTYNLILPMLFRSRFTCSRLRQYVLAGVITIAMGILIMQAMNADTFAHMNIVTVATE